VSLAPNARYDPGGYFIIKGSEKVVIPQKHLQVNKCFVFASTKGPWAWTAEVRALSAKLRSTSTLKVNLRCGPRGSGPLKATVQMPYIGNPGSMHIPLLAMCMLLGFKSAEHVATSVATCGVTSGLTDIPPGSLWDTQSVKTTRLWVLALLRDDAHANPPFETMTPEKIMQWIGEVGTTRKNAKDRVMYVKHLIANEFLPQIGLVYNEKTLARKAQYFAFVLWRLAQVARGFQPGDDRDHAGNKQYDLCGMLLALLLRQHFRAFLKRLMGDIRRCAEQGRLVGVPELLSMKRLTDGLTFALSTGNWGLKKAASSQTGVAQPLSRLNLTATVSHLRRLNTPLKREGKQARPRHIHTSLWGLECPAETPEGPPCGLIGQMAQCTLFCHGHPAARLVRQTSAILGEALFPLLLDKDLLTGATALLPSRPSHLAPKAVIDAYVAVAGSMTALDLEGPGWAGVRAAQAAADRRMFREAPGDVVRVLVNGVLLGFVADGRAAARALRLARRQRRLPFDVAVELYEDQNSLVVSGEAGGRRRALFVLDPKRGLGAVTALWARHRAAPPEAFWRALVLEGAVEYVSKLEEENLLVLQSPTGGLQLHAPLEDYTHCEIHPSAILGLAAAMIPYSDHNQAPRTTYFAAMSKQIAGNPGPETPYANALRLMYPQESLVTTWAQVIYGTQTLSASQNVWVAVLADGGQNQEDSLYVNGDSAARGLFACFTVRTHTEDCQGGTAADSQRFEKPGPHVFGRKTGSYDKLDGEGVVPPGTYIQGGDVVVGKIMLANEILCDKRAVVARCQSYQLHPREKPMGVDSVRRCRGRDDKDLVMVQMHSARFLQVGDKLTSAHGQKGVTGCIKPARDMPWTPGGIVADVLINPHAKPSRMTIGQPLEAGTGLLCARHGVIGDATPFRKPQTTAELAASLNEDLVANGFECMGDHVMHKGETGERIRARVFFGPVSYFRVKQMVDDKHHARARGPVHMTTQQPTEGRSKDGGLRIGEMERDCIQSHGAANVCTDRLFYSSDYAEVPICKVCHLLAMPQAPPDRRDLVVGLNEAAGYCLNCKRAGTVYMTPMPYITKLLSMELMAMHVRPEIVIDVDPRADAATGASVGMPGSAAHTAQAAMQSRKRRVVRFEGDTDDEDVFGAGGTGKDDKPAADGLEEGEVMEAPEGFGPGPQDTDEVHEAPEGFGVGLPRDRPPGSHSSRKRTRVA
jgi:DNA-directed RNA polymerase II subunit RPB2